MRVRRGRGEHGFTMAPVAIMGSIVSLLVAVAFAAANGDLNLTRSDLDHKQAYEAARAGLNDYAYHLNSDTNYWTYCTSVPNPSAVNQIGSTAKRRPVPGNTGASYAIELLPATGKSTCDTNDPVGSMIEQSGPSTGTFRIRSTGYAGKVDQSIVASFKRSSFLDYVYFTRYETSDPVTYGDQATRDGAAIQCAKWIREGRYTAPIPNSGGQFCDVIVFVDGERIEGPVHTNDALVTCGVPIFGRTAADAIEVSGPDPGWFGACGGQTPNFVGTKVTNAPVLTPPPTNGQLKNIAQPAYRYTGQVDIDLVGNAMTVTTSTGTSTVAAPSNGVVYVSNDPNVACSAAYSPFTATYPATSGCGNVEVSGTYNSRLTIAAENDIIIEGNVLRAGTNAMLGLIANNFIRVKHPFSAQTGRRTCNGGSNEAGSLPNLQIDAAMLSILHSFIVDHYDCGAPLGILTVNGAISQRFRGAVGTFGSADTGYRKDYNYDDRLRYVSPPYFLDPVESAWHVQRETLDFP